MLIISADDVDRLLKYDRLTEVLRGAFRAGAVQPQRHHHTVEQAGGANSTLLLMPAWTDFKRQTANGGGHIGVKIVTIAPDNNAIGKPAVMGMYYLADGKTGEPQALIDGQRLTLWRTACASALAASYLARHDASRLLMIGSGALAPFIIRAHAAVRPIREVRIWNRTEAKAAALAALLRGEGLQAESVTELDSAVSQADIVSSATISAEPLVKGAMLRPGTHVDLVGAFSPQLRESDDRAMQVARVYCDTRGGATSEAGDIVQALKSGAIGEDDIIADLYELAREEKAGRQSDDEITLFKSVGAAIEDLAAGTEVFEQYRAERT